MLHLMHDLEGAWGRVHNGERPHHYLLDCDSWDEYRQACLEQRHGAASDAPLRNLEFGGVPVLRGPYDTSRGWRTMLACQAETLSTLRKKQGPSQPPG